MNIYSVYKYFFYRSYVQQTKLFGDVTPKFTAVLMITALLFFNLLTLVACFEIVTGHTVRIEISYGIAGLLGLLLINYFFILYGNKSESIFNEFRSETEVQRKKRAFLCWMYEVGTFVTFFGAVLILSPGPR